MNSAPGSHQPGWDGCIELPASSVLNWEKGWWDGGAGWAGVLEPTAGPGGSPGPRAPGLGGVPLVASGKPAQVHVWTPGWTAHACTSSLRALRTLRMGILRHLWWHKQQFDKAGWPGCGTALIWDFQGTLVILSSTVAIS